MNQPPSYGGPPLGPRGYGRRWGQRGGLLTGIILVVLGVLFLLDNLGLLQFRWDIFWPVALIAVGVYLIVRRLPRT